MPQTSDFLFNLWFKKQNKTPKHLQVNNKYEEKTRYYYSEVKIGELFKKKKKNHISRGHKYHKKAHSLDLTPFLPLSQLFPFLSLICG